MAAWLSGNGVAHTNKLPYAGPG